MKHLFAAIFATASLAAHAVAPTDALVVGRDYHSFADTTAFRVKHLDLDLQASFEDQRLSGVADLTLTRVSPDATKLTLDTRDLTIRQIWWMKSASDLAPLRYTRGAREPMLGSPLNIDLPAELNSPEFVVRIS